MESPIGFRIASQLALRLPSKAAYYLGEKIGVAYGASKREENQAIQENLRWIINRDISTSEMKLLVQQVYGYFVKYLVDLFRIQEISKIFIQRKVSLDGLEQLDEVIKQEQGGILLTAHLGSWEVGGAILATLGYPISVISLSHKDPWVDRFFRQQRLLKGVQTIPIQSALKGAITGLRQRHLIAILADRDYTNQGVPVQFLGKSICLPKGAAYLAIKMGLPVIPTFVIRNNENSIEIHCEKPISYSALKLKKYNDDKVTLLTQRFAQILESYIRRYPTQWLVFRRFWEPITS